MLDLGTLPEDFTLLDQDGEPVQWSSLRGTPVVFFFYPRANTPGCTKEACAFRDLQADFEQAGAAVFGVSADTVRKQGNFRDKHSLTMPLLSDPEHVILEPWGVWGPKKLYGRVYDGIHRSTFLFDAQGAVARVWPKVKVKGHADDVLEAVLALIAG
jgi:peroxiredoxin Q/BCP